jgi:hypothetical protein
MTGQCRRLLGKKPDASKTSTPLSQAAAVSDNQGQGPLADLLAVENSKLDAKIRIFAAGAESNKHRGDRVEGEGQVVTGVDEDLKLIRQIVASGGRKYTAGSIDRSSYDRLVDLRWLIPFKTNISDVEYQVTDEGRAAAAFSIDGSS